MGMVTVIVLLIIVAIIVYIVMTGGSQLCGLPLINLFCKCTVNDPTVGGGDPDGNCWVCPKVNGSQMHRTDDPVTTNTACVGDCTQMYPGGFEDVLSGDCWSCPPKYHKAALTLVQSPAACEMNSCTDKWPGSFWDSENGGECWSCPSGYKPNVLPSVHDSNKCSRSLTDSKPATFLGKTTTSATNKGPERLPAALSPMKLF